MTIKDKMTFNQTLNMFFIYFVPAGMFVQADTCH